MVTKPSSSPKMTTDDERLQSRKPQAMSTIHKRPRVRSGNQRVRGSSQDPAAIKRQGHKTFDSETNRLFHTHPPDTTATLGCSLARQQDTTAVLSACCKKGSTAVNRGTPRYRPSAVQHASPGAVVRFPSSRSTQVPPADRTTPSVQDQPLGPSLGRETSGSSEKPGEVARAFLLVRQTDSPVGAGGDMRGGRAGL